MPRLTPRSHTNRPAHPNACPGFTLIELLVVISIVALLVGILLPVLSSVRKAGKATLCLSNLRSLGQATLAYSADYKRQLPQPADEQDLGNSPEELQQRADALWFNALDAYLGNIVSDGSVADRNYNSFKQDPSYQDLPVTVNGTEYPEEEVRTIKMNAYFAHDTLPGLNTTATHGEKAGNPIAFYKTTDVPESSDTMIYADGRAHDTPRADGGIDPDEFAMNETYVGLRHGDSANLTMVDGSAETQENPIRLTTNTEYRVWYDRYANSMPDREFWPEVIFNFRPESFDKQRLY